MSMYFSKYDSIIYTYLNKANAKKRPVRTLSQEEWEIEHLLRQTKKNANGCITEMLLVKRIINKLEVPELFWVSQNFERMIKSMIKQRNFVAAVCASFMGLKPDNEELKAIRYQKKKLDNRIQFIHAVPIPENIELTPLKEYIEIIGADKLTDELKKEFPTGADMYTANIDGRLDAYVDSILDRVRAEGKENNYKDRLMKYVNTEKDRQEKKKQERLEEKLAYEESEAKNGIDLFQQLFFKGIRTLDGCEKIGMGKRSVNNVLYRGHRGDFLVLVCGLSRNKLIYRYLKDNGTLAEYFGGAGFYKTIGEAESKMRTAMEAYPGKAFAVVAV